jgi:Ca-activated chloride channel family protein
MHFANPYALLTLLLLPVLIWWHRRQLQQSLRLALPFSDQAQLLRLPVGIWQRLHNHKEVLIWLALVCVIIGMARPRRTLATWPVWGQGIDIELVLDTSSSMLQTDLAPNRMIVAKQRLKQFIAFRRQKDDRLGIVLFAKRAFSLCPLTVDHRMLSEMLNNVQVGVIADDTALGDALATALARLRHAKTRQRAILLVTDGENNAGSVHPLTAAALAKQMQIPIFPLLIGKTISSQSNQPAGNHLTPWQILQKVASTSGGSAYHATTQKRFQKALLKILDQMTPTRNQTPRVYSVHQELVGYALGPGIACLLLFFLLQFTRLRSIP